MGTAAVQTAGATITAGTLVEGGDVLTLFAEDDEFVQWLVGVFVVPVALANTCCGAMFCHSLSGTDATGTSIIVLQFLLAWMLVDVGCCGGTSSTS